MTFSCLSLLIRASKLRFDRKDKKKKGIFWLKEAEGEAEAGGS